MDDDRFVLVVGGQLFEDDVDSIILRLGDGPADKDTTLKI
jgi:hypothetical protein